MICCTWSKRLIQFASVELKFEGDAVLPGSRINADKNSFKTHGQDDPGTEISI